MPFGLYTQSIVIIRYHPAGHHPSVVRDHRHRAPWYTPKRYPSYLEIRAVRLAWAHAAA